MLLCNQNDKNKKKGSIGRCSFNFDSNFHLFDLFPRVLFASKNGVSDNIHESFFILFGFFKIKSLVIPLVSGIRAWKKC